ncbi:MAG: GNAT family N-acetyltransferase [Bacilli bacterium]|nr:GNAT family N-acetyltransferase [Bacilli bacterium]
MRLELLEYVSENLPKDFDPYYIYLIIVDNQEVGRIVYREGDDLSRYYDGHIGYHIEEEYRGHHYSYDACLLLKEKIDKEYVYITCDPGNIASQRIIEKLGCEFIESSIIPRSLRHVFNKDEKEKLIYRWWLK